MELLPPSPPLISPQHNLCSSVPSTSGFPNQRPRSSGGDEEKVHVAVGRTLGKGEGLLRWAFRQFRCREIVLVHVHKPSPTIPTLLGKMPVQQANEVLLANHRREEKENTKKILMNYVGVCNRAKVKVSIITIENSNISEGIVDLITKNNIKKLVMGTATDNFMKVKKSFNKASYTAKNAPPFCEIWFVCKDKHIRTRKVTEDPTSLRSVNLHMMTNTVRTLSGPLDHCTNDLIPFTADELSGERNRSQNKPDQREIPAITTNRSMVMCDAVQSSQHPMTADHIASWLASSTEEIFPSEASSMDEVEQHLLNKSETGVDKSLEEEFTEVLKHEELGKEAAEAINKIKAFEASCAHETKLRKELEAQLRTVRKEKEKLLKKKYNALEKLQTAKESIAMLEEDAREMARCQDVAADELKQIQSSIVSLKIQRHIIRQQKEEAKNQLEWWKSQIAPNFLSCSGFLVDSFHFSEFSLSDLQTATDDFSERFKIGQGGYGCVYKGWMLDKSVAIKKLHSHYRQGQMEFQCEVHVLSRLKHPHLVTLIGACVEAWALVYDYMPNGTLQDQLLRRNKLTSNWSWKDRICTAAEICGALHYMHTSKPEMVIHGDLKPENILFDSDFKCKISDFGICRLAPEDTMHCPSFRRFSELKGQFSYKDPEYDRTGELTPKSDVYSFGLIILQLLTGRMPEGLASEVRQAMLAGKLSAVLDVTAGEWPISVAVRLAEFGLQCCDMNSQARPELTVMVVKELEQLHILEEKPAPHFFLCPILQEIMHDPQVAADGFTYEGQALRSWLENGRETSPMTNLKLDHLDLTPNHALRSAIQDWMRRSK